MRLTLLSVQGAVCAVRNPSGVSYFCLNFTLYSDFHWKIHFPLVCISVILCRGLLPFSEMGCVKLPVFQRNFFPMPVCATVPEGNVVCDGGCRWPVHTSCHPHGCQWWLEQHLWKRSGWDWVPREALELLYLLLLCSCSHKSGSKAQIDWSRGCNCRKFGCLVGSGDILTWFSQQTLHHCRPFHKPLTGL